MPAQLEARRLDATVQHWARHAPAAVACVCAEERVTYADLAMRIEAATRALIGAGVKHGDRIAILSPPHLDFVETLLAVSSIGAIWVGLNPRYQRDELLYVLTDSTPSILFAKRQIGDRDFRSDLDAIQRAAPDLRIVYLDADEADPTGWTRFISEGSHVSGAELDARRALVAPRDPCMIVYTSGSTGRPKGALLHHDGVLRFSRLQNEIWPLSPYVTLNFLPINHIGCVVDLTLPALDAGGTIVFLERFDATESLRVMERERVTFWASVPSVFQLQMAAPEFDAIDLSAVQLIVWEGAAMPEEWARRLAAICPRMATNYGMTETTSAITIAPPSSDIEMLTTSVGHAFPGVEIRLVREDGSEVPVGEPGEVWARSENNFLGYWRRPEATDAAFTADGYFRTGDLAVRRGDGRYAIVGRLKEMYKSGGYNVYPREVEAILEDHPAVEAAAVVPIDDPVWQEVGVAFVVTRGDVGVEELLAFCRARLANYKAPKHIHIEATLPLLPIGKVDKQALREAARRRHKAGV